MKYEKRIGEGMAYSIAMLFLFLVILDLEPIYLLSL